MSEPTPEQIAAFKVLLDKWMVEFAKLPADVQAKYNAEETEFAATGKPMTESPDHIRGLELHKQFDVNNDGMLDLAEWTEFNKKMEEEQVAKYGATVPHTPESLAEWWNVVKTYSPGDGVTIDDMNFTAKLYGACFAEMG